MSAKKKKSGGAAIREGVGRSEISDLRLERPLVARFGPPVLIVLAGLAAYCNSFSGVFVLDDNGEIVANEDIRGILPISRWMHDPRPVVKLSFAMNYAVGGLNPAGYHAVNLAIHILAGFCLYGIARRTLIRVGLSHRDAIWSGMAIALIWLVHPLQTQSVTYVVQRGESLMGLLYLLTLYCFALGVETKTREGIPAVVGARKDSRTSGSGWLAGAVIACALGMATKAVMVTAPVLVLLYDRTFVAGSFSGALRSRWRFYLGLAGTWGILLLLGVFQGVVGSGQGGPVTVGFGTGGVSAWDYLLTQTGVILHYIRLFLWPYPLCLDYAWPIARSARDVIVPGMIVLVLLGVTAYLVYRRPAYGFLCAAFFVLLAPTSSFVPIKDVIFEHRMYLPLAALAAIAVIAARQLLARRVGWTAQAALAAMVIVVLAAGTLARNRDYQNEARMWRDVVARYPGNARAQSSLGVALAIEGRLEEAIAAYRAALAADAEHVEARGNLGKALSKVGRYAEAVEHFERVLQKDPDDVTFRHSYAVALGRVGRRVEEIAQYREVIGMEPEHGLAHYNLAVALTAQNDVNGAIGAYREVIRITPADVEARKNLGDLLMRTGQTAAAVEEYRRALAINPGFGAARAALEAALRKQSGP